MKSFKHEHTHTQTHKHTHTNTQTHTHTQTHTNTHTNTHTHTDEYPIVAFLKKAPVTREGFLRKNIVAVSFLKNCAIHPYS